MRRVWHCCFVLVIAAAAAAAEGCSWWDGPAATAAPPDTSGTDSVPGTLTASDTTSAGFANFVSTLDWSNPVSVQRECRGSVKCYFGKTVPVEISAPRGNGNYNAYKGSGETVIAKMRNDDPDPRGPPERMFGLLPGVDYYIIVQAHPTTPTVRITTNVTVPGSPGRYTPCGPTHSPPPQQAADFCRCNGTCPDRGANYALGREGRIRMAGFFAGLSLLFNGGSGDPGWTKCSYGCCTVDPD